MQHKKVNIEISEIELYIHSALIIIFMSFHETIWLNDGPLEFKPALYKRYVDDTFLLFNNASHIQPFLDYLNSRHPTIKFIKVIESTTAYLFWMLRSHRRTLNFIT